MAEVFQDLLQQTLFGRRGCLAAGRRAGARNVHMLDLTLGEESRRDWTLARYVSQRPARRSDALTRSEAFEAPDHLRRCEAFPMNRHAAIWKTSDDCRKGPDGVGEAGIAFDGSAELLIGSNRRRICSPYVSPRLQTAKKLLDVAAVPVRLGRSSDPRLEVTGRDARASHVLARESNSLLQARSSKKPTPLSTDIPIRTSPHPGQDGYVQHESSPSLDVEPQPRCHTGVVDLENLLSHSHGLFVVECRGRPLPRWKEDWRGIFWRYLRGDQPFE
jgi:hypothetical protein